MFGLSIGYCSTNGCSVIESCSCNVLSLGFVRPRKKKKNYIYIKQKKNQLKQDSEKKNISETVIRKKENISENSDKE